MLTATCRIVRQQLRLRPTEPAGDLPRQFVFHRTTFSRMRRIPDDRPGNASPRNWTLSSDCMEFSSRVRKNRECLYSACNSATPAPPERGDGRCPRRSSPGTFCFICAQAPTNGMARRSSNCRGRPRRSFGGPAGDVAVAIPFQWGHFFQIGHKVGMVFQFQVSTVSSVGQFVQQPAVGVREFASSCAGRTG